MSEVTLPVQRRQSAAISGMLQARQILEELVSRELRSRYKRSVLGILWTLVNPLLMMAVTTMIFANVFRFAIHNFPLYMLSAQVAWNLFAQGTANASTSILGNAGISKKIRVSYQLFPIAAVLASTVTLALSLVAISVVMIFTGASFTFSLLFLPISIVIATVFTIGVSLILSSISVFFHDAVYLYQVALTAWMYLTPIFYPFEVVPEEVRGVMLLNPLYYMIELFRVPIYEGNVPEVSHILVAAWFAAVANVIGWWQFRRVRNDFAVYL